MSGGYFNSETDLSHPVFLPFSTNTDGAVAGLFSGYNYQIDSVVLGLEADFYIGFGGKTKLAGLPVPSVLKSTEYANWSLRGRLGWARGQFMPYVAGGYTGMTNKQTFATGYVGNDSETLHGWTIGGGAEYRLTPKWLMRLDYQYQDFGERTYFKTLIAPTGIKQEVTTNQITVGVSYKF